MTHEAPDSEPLLITSDMLARQPARETRLDFERGMTYAPPFTLLLLLALSAIFVWQVASGSLANAEALIASGALSRARVLQGEWWRVITATFLHGSPQHLIGNGISLYILGMASEHAFGTKRAAALYVACGVGGSLLSMGLGPGPSVGASGAIFGLMGAVITALTLHRDRFYVRDKRIAGVLAAWAIFTLASGLLTPYVDNGAHLGGLLSGIACAYIVPMRPRRY